MAFNTFASYAEPSPAFVPPESDFYSPGEDWARFTAGMDPFWERRAPLDRTAENLRARYLMSAPYMGEAAPVEPTFARFLGGYQGAMGGVNPGQAYATQPGELRNRAQEAAEAAAMNTNLYMAQAANDADLRRRAWLSSQFGQESPNRVGNQLAVANLLAQQRPGGTSYSGRTAGAIQSTVQRMYQKRLNRGGSKGGFLDWFLQKRGGSGNGRDTI